MKTTNDNFEERIATLTQKIHNEPNNAKLFISRAKAFTVSKKFIEALSDYSKAIELESTNTNYLRDRAIFFSNFVENNNKALADDYKII